MNSHVDPPGVVVGVDGSPEALQAVRWAVAEAGRQGASLRLVAVHSSKEFVVGYPGKGDHDHEFLHDLAKSHLDRATALVTEIDPGRHVEQSLAVGHPVDILVGEGRRAQLLVVGDRGLGRIASALTGSVAVGVATHAACPVVVVRGSEPSGSNPAPVVVGVSGRPAGDAAVGFAFEAAAARRAPLIAVQTWGDPPGDLRMGPIWEVLAADAKALLSAGLAGWIEKYPEVTVHRVVSHSRPAHQLLDLATNAQLLVVGSRGHGELAGIVLGSVSNVLIHRAPCPVAIVRQSQQ